MGGRGVSLALIFLLALAIRLLFFPGNIYFGFDQARDAFVVQELLHGHLKLVGPPTQNQNLFHGVLYYYLFAPFYFLGGGNPAWVSIFLRVVNALGVVVVFGIGKTIFNKRVGWLAALFYAISFEQSQYAIYLNHPSLGVLSVMVFYLGLAMLIFGRNRWGWVVSLLGLGLSLQFELASVYLVAIWVVMMIVFGKRLEWRGSKRAMAVAAAVFVASIASFILVEFKFGFRTIKNLTSIVDSSSGQPIDYWHNIEYISSRYVGHNLMGFGGAAGWVGLLLLINGGYLIVKHSDVRAKIIFLLIWFGGGLLPYLRNQLSLPLYYHTAGASVSLLIFVGFLLDKMWAKQRFLVVAVMLAMVVSNLTLIWVMNPKGSIPEINVQSGMLLEDEKKVVDFSYASSGGQPFAVNSLSMPYNVDTTWSYLYEWYGQKKYGYQPIWGADAALGFPGNFKIVSARSRLPARRFSIIEPTRGVPVALINDFLNNENLFTTVVAQKQFGQFVVQQRQPR